MLRKLKLNNFKELELIGIGTYSNVFKFGHYVLKVGLAKRREKIIEHPYIIKTYLRTNIRFKLENFTIIVGIEIQEYAENICKISEDELYKIYYTLRQNRLIWRDIKPSNIKMFKNQPVIIDTDDIYVENGEKPHYYTELDKFFEEKYCNFMKYNI